MGFAVETQPGQSDAELLERFARERSERAFEILVQRHGPMVMGVCRRMLVEPQIAEDAFQTTFLLLLQKCDSIERPHLLGNWLYGVAYRVSAGLRAKTVRRKECELQETGCSRDDPDIEATWREVRSLLDQEMQRLPEKHRLPLILCYLQGKTHVEAARQLGWPSGSMSDRLTKAREALRCRLARCGLSIAVAHFALLLTRKTSSAALSPRWLSCTKPAVLSGRSLPARVLGNAVIEQLVGPQRSLLSYRCLSALLLLFLLFLLGAHQLKHIAADQTRMPSRSQLDGEAGLRGADQSPSATTSAASSFDEFGRLTPTLSGGGELASTSSVGRKATCCGSK